MTEHTARLDAFIEKISKLDIQVSVNGEGVFTACSASEPHFCFDGYSQAEVADRAADALESYARLFFGLEGLTLRPLREDIPEPVVKIEAVRPVSKLALAVA